MVQDKRKEEISGDMVQINLNKPKANFINH